MPVYYLTTSVPLATILALLGLLLDKGEGRKKEPHGGPALIRFLVLRGRFDYSSKAFNTYSQGYYEEEDLVNAVANGSVVKKEKDEEKNSIGNVKYTLLGPDTQGYEFYCCGKLIGAADGKLFYVITAHHSGGTYV